jgi:pimeloyl-ACP methyl ester carboxylesterase
LLTKRLHLPGGWLHYFEGGAHHSTTPILFLHGWALAADLFREGLALLAVQRRVIGLDWPGFNGSDWSVAGWRYEDYAGVIAAFADSLALPPYHLVGHSTGGGIAIACAVCYPKQVRSLTLIDSVGIPLTSFWRVLGRKLLEIPAQFIAMPHLEMHGKLVRTVLFNWVFRAANTYHCMQLPLYADEQPYLARLRAPCLVVWGERDGMVPLALGRCLAQAIPGAQWLVLPWCYHEWSILQPQLFARIVANFIGQLESASDS